MKVCFLFLHFGVEGMEWICIGNSNFLMSNLKFTTLVFQLIQDQIVNLRNIRNIKKLIYNRWWTQDVFGEVTQEGSTETLQMWKNIS